MHRPNHVAAAARAFGPSRSHSEALRQAFNAKLKWEPGTGSVTSAPLYRLGGGDLRDFARTLSCQQDIAADGALRLEMLARFELVLRERRAGAYREIFWEAGMIGQVLYPVAGGRGRRGSRHRYRLLL